MKKISLIALIAMLCLALAVPALAKKDDNNGVGHAKKDKENKESREAGVYLPRALNMLGEVTAVSSNTLPADLTVKVGKISPPKMKDFPGTFPTKDSMLVVHLTADTKIVRKYSGRADFSELTIGDSVDIHGKLQSDGSLNATVVKNNSITKKESTVKRLELKKEVMERKVEAARAVLDKLLLQLEAILKKLSDAAATTTPSSTAPTTDTSTTTTSTTP